MLRPPNLRTDDRARGGLSELMQTRSSAVLPMRKLLQLAGLPRPYRGRLTLAMSDQLGQLLDRSGLALEPDHRYDGWSPGLDDEVVVFKAEYGGPINSERRAYLETKVRIDAMALSVATGNSTGGEFASIKSEITEKGFSHIERARLLAYAFASLASAPKLRRKKWFGGNRSQFFVGAVAGILFGFAIVSAHLAVISDHSPGVHQLSRAELRQECSLISNEDFRADCLQQAQAAEGNAPKTLDNSPH
jgi:hypothetical protein